MLEFLGASIYYYRHMKFTNLLLLLLILGLVFGSSIVYRELGTNAPEVIGQLKDFRLTENHGEEFSSTSLRNKVWIANFYFTSCQNTCPLTMRHISDISAEFTDHNLHVASITVDPDRDTKTTVENYMEKLPGSKSNWHLLTGTKQSIKEVSLKSFMLGTFDDPSIHTDRIVLIDRQGEIRGYYAGTKQEEIDKLRSDLKAVFRE